MPAAAPKRGGGAGVAALVAVAAAAGVKLATLAVLKVEYVQLRKRVLAAAFPQPPGTREPFVDTWFDKDNEPRSGVHLMESLFTISNLHNGLGNILYLLSHCVTKSSCEAVVESIGSKVDKHADSVRAVARDVFDGGVHRVERPAAAPLQEGAVRGADQAHRKEGLALHAPHPRGHEGGLWHD